MPSFAKTMSTLMLVFLGMWHQVSSGALLSVLPSSVTRIVGSQAIFEFRATNVTNGTNFQWTVGGSMVANVTVSDPNLMIEVASEYNLTALGSLASGVNVTFTIKNVVQPSTNVEVSGDMNSANATLNVQESCGMAPTGDGSCNTFKCMVNSTIFVGQPAGSNSVNTFNCYNTSTCGADANWSMLMKNCDTVAVGCLSSSKWGTNCNNMCGAGCPFNMCHFINGSCLDASGFVTTCSSGYTGSLCNQMVCANNKWGDNCSMSCGSGCKTQCNKANGYCQVNETIDCKLGWTGPKCDVPGCKFDGVWGVNCSRACGMGCPVFVCDFATGRCLDNATRRPLDNPTCRDGYTGSLCEAPICGDCQGGTCLEPSFCGLCPIHFASGTTCRNIRLDGFLKGSIPTFAILTLIVVLLTVSSKWYIRRKLKLA